MTTIQITTNDLRDKDLFTLHSILHMYQTTYPETFSYNSEYIIIHIGFPDEMLYMLYNDLNTFFRKYDGFNYKTLDDKK